MNKLEYYDNIIAPLSKDLKMKAKIESLRFEKELYKLNIEHLEKKVLEQQKLKAEDYMTEVMKENIDICITEFEVKIMEHQNKMKMCDIQITRECYNLKHYKGF
tara:strand:+ start:68 stop:379 length:312 start_codon:yes stop_codon:yes gene_type:complete